MEKVEFNGKVSPQRSVPQLKDLTNSLNTKYAYLILDLKNEEKYFFLILEFSVNLSCVNRDQNNKLKSN